MGISSTSHKTSFLVEGEAVTAAKQTVVGEQMSKKEQQARAARHKHEGCRQMKGEGYQLLTAAPRFRFANVLVARFGGLPSSLSSSFQSYSSPDAFSSFEESLALPRLPVKKNNPSEAKRSSNASIRHCKE